MTKTDEKPQPDTRAVKASDVPNAWQCPFCQRNNYVDLVKCKCGAKLTDQTVTK